MLYDNLLKWQRAMEKAASSDYDENEEKKRKRERPSMLGGMLNTALGLGGLGLGGYGLYKAYQASNTANNALTTANGANRKAGNALTTANRAYRKAGDAINIAGNASTAADTAQGLVDALGRLLYMNNVPVRLGNNNPINDPQMYLGWLRNVIKAYIPQTPSQN